jgi:hypothetical protein
MKDSSAIANNEAPFVAQSGLSTADLWPFGYDAKPGEDYSDLAKITIDQFRQISDNAYQSPPSNVPPFAGPVDWFRPMDEVAPNQVTRFAGSSTVVRPITPLALSRTVPYFLGHCSQFIVEYAGDYLKQDEADPVEPGKVVDALSKKDLKAPYKIETGETDGQIDYIDPSNGKPYNPVRPAAQGRDKWVRRIRWYGLPRDVNGDGRITIHDVVPMADVLDYYNIRNSAESMTGFTGAAWENLRDLPSPALTDPKLDTNNPYRPWKCELSIHLRLAQ